jgi:excisionase family DNA binding protein
MREIEGVRLYTIPEAAAALEVSAQTVRSYIKSGQLSAQRVGRPYLITGESLRRFVSGSSSPEVPQVERNLKNGLASTRILPQ